MDSKAEIRDFLTTRRARLTPEQAGLQTFGGMRRVKGLRREEVAHLAGVSVDYYTRLERGKAAGTSPEVLNAIARALQLDEVESEHLRDLFSAVRPAVRTPKVRQNSVRPTVQKVLDALDLPAFVQNHRLEVLAANPLGHALYAAPDHAYRLPLPFSMPRFLFLDPRSPDFYPDWPRVAHNQVALLRSSAGRHPDDPA